VGTFIATFVAAIAVQVSLPQQRSETMFAVLFFAGGQAGSALVAALILARHPRHPIGWLFAASAIGAASHVLAQGAAASAIVQGGSGWPLTITSWYAQWAIYPSVNLTLFVLLLFPDGRLPSRRWRPLGLIVWALLIYLVVGVAFGQSHFTVSRVVVPNPLFVQEFAGLRALAPLQLPVFILCLAAFLWRFRGAGRDLRAQLAWVVYGAAGYVLLTALGRTAHPVFGAPRELGLGLQNLGSIAFPVSVGIAIFRYRLYDIDILIRRTIVYGALSAILVATYAAGVILFQAALRPLTGGSELAVAASTLAVVALAQPLRRRIQAVVDRRFYRSRYDAARTLDAFSARMRDQVDMDAVRREVLDVVGATVQPAHAGVWLRQVRR
jgi:hypothetical protein